MIVDLVSRLVPLFVAIVWAATVIIAAVLFRQPLKKVAERFSSADEVSISLGNLSLQAKTMRDLQGSINVGFSEDTLQKKDLQAFLDMRLQGIQTALEHHARERVLSSDVRRDRREMKEQKIKITTETGKVFDGETLDVSPTGVGFHSPGRLRLMETVKIAPVPGQQGQADPVVSPVRIVRIYQSKRGYHYGAAVPDIRQ